MSIPSEAWRDAPRALRKVAHREAYSDVLGGIVFVDGVAQSGMPETVLARLLGIGVPVVDLGPWEAAADPLAALPTEPAPTDAPVESTTLPTRPAPSPSVYVPPSRRR